MLESGGKPEGFERKMASMLRKWLLTCPPGIGLGTLRAIVKSFFVARGKSGVYSAGNGPAMRSALLGLLAVDEAHLAELVKRSTRLTHSDPRAEEGALVVAKAARFAAIGNGEIVDFIHRVAETTQGEELREHFSAVEDGLRRGLSPREFAEQRGWKKGISGYVNQTVPAALYCWACFPDDFSVAVTEAVLLGGDTDSVAAITGGICGAGVGFENLPAGWLEQLAEWPRDKVWMADLAERLHRDRQKPTGKPASSQSLRWGRTLFRNLIFGVLVLFLYFRRFVPVKSKQ
jgi:ADP-ribosylglycohydrolase